MACGCCGHKYPFSRNRSSGTTGVRPVGRYRPPGVSRRPAPSALPGVTGVAAPSSAVPIDSHVETVTGTDEVLGIEKA